MHTKIMYCLISILTLVLTVSSQDMTETDVTNDIPDCAPEPVSIYQKVCLFFTSGYSASCTLPDHVGVCIQHYRRMYQYRVARHALECPRQAVCADEWITIRSRSNGSCKDHRIIFNCGCPRNDTCPVGANDHLLYGNKKHRMYLCESKCSIGMCGLATRAAEEMVQNSPEFNHYNFYRINCRCPGHNEPLDSRPGTLRRSTYYGRQRFDFQRSITYHEYRCTDIDSSHVDATCN